MIKKLNKRFISFILAFTMIFTNFFSIANINTVYGQDTKTEEAAEVQYTVNDAIEALKNQLSSKEQLKGWEVVGAKRSGLDISKIKTDKKLQNKNRTEFEDKVEQSIILMELGEKPEELINEIADGIEESLNDSGLKIDEVKGILAVEKYNKIYKNKIIKYPEEEAIDFVMDKCANNGAIFSASVNTANSMELLFKYKKDQEVEGKIKKAAKFIQTKMQNDGAIYGFSFNINQQIDTVESLVKAGQNLTDKDWTKNSNTPIDGLFKGWNGKEYVEGHPTSETVGKVLNTLVTLKEEGYGDYVLKGVKFDGYNKVEDGKDSNKEDNKEKGYTVDDAVKVLVKYYEKDYYYSKGKTLDGLKAAAMKKAGADLSKWTIDKETDSFKKSWCPLAAKAETSMILMDFGENPAQYKERNLIKEIADNLDKISNAKGLGRNEVKGLIAIDRYNETFKDNKVEYNVEKVVKHLLGNQKEDGSFYDTPQTTAKAMWALSKHKDIEGVTEAIKKAKDYVKNNQKDDGGIYTKKFFTYIQADAVNYLIAQGEDLTSKEWIKDGKNPIEGIFVLWNGKNFTKDTKTKDEYPIDKVLYALASLKEKGYGNYVLKGVKFVGIKSDGKEEEKTCKVNVSVVYTNKDGKYDIKFAPQQVSINNKNPKHYAKFTVLGALQASTDNYEEKNGYVSSILGIEAEDSNGWMYTVNGKIPDTYAHETPVKDGDKVIWYYAYYDAKTKEFSKTPTWDELIKPQDSKEENYNVNDAIQALKAQFKNKKELKGWEVVGAKKAGLDLSEFKIDKETEKFKGNKNDISNKAEQSIILMGLGEKPEQLIKEIAEELKGYIEKQTVSADSIKAMYAVERYNEIFKNCKINYDYKKAVKAIVEKQQKTGSIAWADFNTALAINILLNHKDVADVKGIDKAIELGLKYIHGKMKNDGGLYDWSFNAYNQSEMVYVLSKANVDLKDKFTTKEGKTIIDGLFVAWNGKEYDEKFNDRKTIKRDEVIGELLNTLVTLKEKGYGNYVLKGVKFDGYKKTEEPQENPDQKVNENTVDGLINKVVDYYNKEYFYEKNGLLDSWQYGTLVRAKADLSKKNWTLQEEYITNQDRNLNLIGTKIDQSLMLLDRGKNPNNFKGRKLINEIKEYLDAYKERFTFIDIQGVIAIDRYNKKFPDAKVNYNVNHAIEKILESQEQNGGFKEREEGICARNTGVALIALNNHKDIKGVNESIQKAIKYLHDIQKLDGGLYNETFITGYHGEALQGLIEVGENPTSKEWTTEKGRNPIDALFKLYKSNDSFDNMAYESKHNRGWWEGTWKALYTLLDAKEAGYGKYEPKGIGEYKVDVDEVQKKCKVNIAIVQPKKDGFDCLMGPKQVEINNKEHKAGITALGALQATTTLYEEMGGMVSEIYGRKNKGNGGWTYLVNDVMPDILSNQYEVKEGDNIVWYYSINGMNDNAPKWEQLTQKGKDYSTIINDNLIKSAKFIAGKDKLDYFDVISLRGISKKQYENQFKKYVQDIEKAIKNKDESLFNKNGQIKDIDCAKAIIGLTAAGQDARNVAGVNLIEELCKTDLIEEALKKDSNDNINLEPIAYALLALDSGKYKTSKDSKVTRDKLVKVLLDNSRKDKKYKPYMGGWNDNEKAGEPDKPLTGIVLAALAPYRDNKDVKKEVDRAIDLLAELQGGNGGFGQRIGFSYKKYSEMSSKVIIGLCLNGVEPTSDKFTKEEGNLLECVLKHATKDGFSQEKGKETNEVSTSYAIQALTSYKNYKDKKEGIYTFEDFSGKIVEKPEEPQQTEKPQEQKDYSKEVQESIEICVDYILKIENLSNWHAAALKAASSEIPERYIKSKKRAIITKDPKFIKNGEIADNNCATTIIGVTAAGKDARNISGFNLIEHLCKEGKIDHNKIHRSIFALIALDCGKYEIPKNSKLTRQELINDMTWTWDDEEGWSPWGGGIDPDTTGMALTALAPYKDQEEAKEVINKAVKKLSAAQNKNGGYNFKYENEVNESSESIAQVIIGLCSNGIDPTSKEFTKNGNNLIDALLKFRTKEGFSHIKDGRTNEMSTYQVLQALGAYKSFKEDKKGIYDFEDFSSKVLKEDGKIEIENLTQNKQFKLGEDAKVRIKAENLESEDKNVTLIVALYNENGEFVNYSSSKQTLKLGQEVELESMIKLPKEGNYELKAFVWDDFEKMTPLSDEINFKIVK